MNVRELFEKQDIEPLGPVQLKDAHLHPFPDTRGVYVVSGIDDPDSNKTIKFELNLERLNDWISRASEMSVDNVPALVEGLSQRLEKFWHPDQSILYIGHTGKGLNTRIKQMIKHAGLLPNISHMLRERRPHRGGHWLYTLKMLPELYLFYSEIPDNLHEHEVELRMLENFIESTDNISLNSLPWANLELKFKGFPLRLGISGRKEHGIGKQVE